MAHNLMFEYCCTLLKRMRVDRKGVTALEYGLLAGLIAVAMAAAVKTLGTNISAVFTAVASKL